MTMPSKKWSLAQRRERNYYRLRAEAHAAKGQVYAEFHAPFWKGILERLREIRFEENGVYVDVGCGPNPILAFAPRGRCIGIDPLMDYFREHFVLPQNLETYRGKIEDLEPIEDGQADVIFSMNNIDHVEDLGAAMRTLHRKLKPAGRLVVSVNVVRNPLMRICSQVFDPYRFVDRTHTYHFHSPAEVGSHFAPWFELMRFESIEDLAEQMDWLKQQHSQDRGAPTAVMRRCAKFVKNHVLLAERLYLFLFSAKNC